MSRARNANGRLAGLRLRSAIAGRQRWQVEAIRRNPALAQHLEKVLLRVHGVKRVEANPVSSRVLIIYTPGELSLDLGLVIQAFVDDVRSRKTIIATTTVKTNRSALIRVLKRSLPRGRKLAVPVMLSVTGQIVRILQGLSFVATVNTASGKGPRFLETLGVVRVRSRMLFMTGLTALLTAADSWLQHHRNRSWAKLAHETEHRLRGRLIAQIEKQDLALFDRYGTARLISVVTADTAQIGDFVEQAGDQTVEKVLTILVSGTLLAVASPLLALLALLPIPFFLLSARVFGEKTREGYGKLGMESGRWSQMLQDNFEGIADVKSFVRERLEARRLRECDARVSEFAVEASSFSSIQSNMARGIFQTGLSLMAGIGGLLSASGEISADEYIRVVYWFTPLMGALTGISDITRPYYGAANAAEEIEAILETRPEVRSGPARLAASDVRGEVVFEGVSFGYEPGSNVLENISFRLNPGETLGIVGPTGSGKSTLIRLLLRFYDVEHGRILLDGTDLRELNLRDLRGAVALVSQEVYLFQGTVMDNVLYGRPSASESEVKDAMQAAGALALEESLPHGLGTEVGERGRRLSGGERQRVAIARALLKGAPILALDEATSHLDYETEFAVKRSLREAAKGKNVILIAHRLSTVRNADRIIVLESGKIREMGSHQELVAQGGLYASLWRLQSGEDQR